MLALFQLSLFFELIRLVFLRFLGLREGCRPGTDRFLCLFCVVFRWFDWGDLWILVLRLGWILIFARGIAASWLSCNFALIRCKWGYFRGDFPVFALFFRADFKDLRCQDLGSIRFWRIRPQFRVNFAYFVGFLRDLGGFLLNMRGISLVIRIDMRENSLKVVVGISLSLCIRLRFLFFQGFWGILSTIQRCQFFHSSKSMHQN